MSSLPPGVTDEMCEGGPEQFCASCGHSANDHLDEKDNTSCDMKNCCCKKFVEGEYEPDWEFDT